MKCALLRERSAEGGSQEDPTGGHMNMPHTSPDRDVEGQAEERESCHEERGGKSKGREDRCRLQPMPRPRTTRRPNPGL